MSTSRGVVRRPRSPSPPRPERIASMAAESSADDRAAVVRTALDYFEGWFDGDAARIERALHPELAKRSLGQGSSDPERLATLTALQMVEATARGEGQREDPGDRRIEVEVEHLHGTIANATVRSAVYVEYLQLVPTRHGRKMRPSFVSVLWGVGRMHSTNPRPALRAAASGGRPRPANPAGARHPLQGPSAVLQGLRPADVLRSSMWPGHSLMA